MTRLPIKSEDAGRIIGKKGAVVKSVIKESGAHVRVIPGGQSQVCSSFLSKSSFVFNKTEQCRALTGFLKLKKMDLTENFLSLIKWI